MAGTRPGLISERHVVRPARTDVLTVDQQMREYIDAHEGDPVFRWDLQLFLQDCGASFDLPVVTRPVVAPRTRRPIERLARRLHL